MPDYEADNIFDRILNGDLPCHRVFEDDVALGFMDVMPRVDGHTLVIPKVRVRNLLDIGPDDLSALIVRVQRVGIAAQRAMRAPGLTLHQFNEEAGGQQVFHLHFHIMPRHPDIALRPPGGPTVNPDLLARQAQLVRAELER